MARVDPGELRWKIRIEIPTFRISSEGAYERGEPRVIETHAAVRAIKARDDLYAGAERAQATTQFIVRWRDGIDTSACVIFKGRRYELEFVDPVPFADRYMRLKGTSYEAGVGE